MKRALPAFALLAPLAAMLCALPVHADEAGKIAIDLTRHLTQHGKQVVNNDARLVGIGDVSFSGLKDDLREACNAPHACLHAHGVSVEETLLAMYLLVARRSEQELDVRIKSLQSRNEQIRRLSDELKEKHDRGDHREIDRLKKEIGRLNADSSISMIDIQQLINKRNEAHDVLSNLLNKQQKALDGIVHNMR